MSGAPTDQDLRAAALAALGPHGDPRARAALERAEVVLHRVVTSWEGSHGAVAAYRVDLGLDAASLGRVRTVPAVHDALCAALAAALSHRPGCTLGELHTGWHARDESGATAYRGVIPRRHARDDPTALARAAAEYLHAVGEDEAAGRVARGVLEVDLQVRRGRRHGRVVLRCTAPDHLALGDPARWAPIEACLRALAGEDESDELTVRRAAL